MNIDEKLEKNYMKIKGYTYKITNILAFICPRLVNLKQYKKYNLGFVFMPKNSTIYNSWDMSNFVGTLLSFFYAFFSYF